MWQVSYPSANGASLGSKLVKNIFFVKRGKPNVQTFFEKILMFDFMRHEVKKLEKHFWGLAHERRNIAHLRQTDRHTNSLTPYIDRVRLKTSLKTTK